MKKITKLLILIVGISFIMELGVFNYKHWVSLTFKDILNTYTTVLSEGFYDNGDGTYTILADRERKISISNINQNLKNIEIGIKVIEPTWTNTFTSKVNLSDDGNKLFYHAGNHIFVNNDARTNLVRIHPFGNVQEIELEFDFEDYSIVQINTILFNQVVPLNFSFLRFISTGVLLFFFMGFGKRSTWYKQTYSKNMKNIIMCTFALCQIILFAKIATINPGITQGKFNHFLEYQKLAVSLTNGDFALEDKPSEELIKLENPYDVSARNEKKVDYLWDHAYYNGKYYVYFGVGPVLLYYLPYYILTGTDLVNHLAIIMSLSIFIISIYLLFNKLANKYYKNVPFPMVVFLSFVTVFGSGAFLVVHKPDIYSVPIITGLAFATLGVYFWIKSIKKDSINNLQVILGSCCMAFVATCRPQLVLMSFLAIPIFWKEICKLQTNKKSRVSLIYALIPFILIAIVLGYYNYARFGSVLDFGANYNLTTNDMTKRGIDLDRNLIGFFKYLVELPVISTVFPFLKPTLFDSDYIGITIYENTYGGLFACNLILLINIFIFKFKRTFKYKQLYYVSLMSLFIGLIVVFLDIQMAGILQRYFSDFSIFFFLPAVILLLTIFDSYSSCKWINSLYFIIFILGVLCILYNSLFLIVLDQTNISVHNPTVYYNLYSMLQWW